MIIIVAIYLFSALKVYTWIRKSHSSGGIHYKEDIDRLDLLFTFFPFVNTICTIILLFKSPVWKNDSFLNKFYMIKGDQ